MRRITITVLDSETRAPVVGAYVAIYEQGFPYTSGRTDNQGQFSFDADPSIVYYMIIEKESYAPHKQLIDQDTPSNLTVMLRKWRQITITVLDDVTRAPLSGAYVALYYYDERQPGGLGDLYEIGYTNAQGQISFKIDPSIVYVLEARTSYHGTHYQRIDRNTPSDLTITLQRIIAEISVIVIDETNNNRIAGAQVIIKKGQAVVAQAITDNNGYAGFTLFYDKYTIEVSATGYQTTSRDIEAYPNSTINIWLKPLQGAPPSPPTQPPSPIQPPPAPPAQPPTQPPTQPPQQPPAQSVQSSIIDKKLLLLGLGALAVIALLGFMSKKDEEKKDKD